MKRYDILDGFRGYFLVFMLVNHLAFQGGSLVARFNHAELGYVQDAQGFIFISGLIVGLYYARGYLKGNAAATDRKLLARCWLLYRYSLALVAFVFALAFVLPGAEVWWGAYFPEFFRDAVTTTIGAALLLYQPTFMDILPQYILYILVSPFLIRLVLNGRADLVIAASIVCWLTVQFGHHVPMIAGIEALGQAIDSDFITRAAFKPMAWQILFVGGLVIGCGITAGTLDLDAWFSPRRRALFAVAVGLVLLFLVYRLGFTLGYLPEDVGNRFLAHDNRNEFSLVYLVNFIALGYAMTWILRCGGESDSVFLRALAGFMHRLFGLGFLRFIGQHSLQVYAYHVGLIYLVFILDRRYGPLSEPLKAAITVAGVASLWIPAWLHARYRESAAAMPKRAASA
jgi:hypothetical protein